MRTFNGPIFICFIMLVTTIAIVLELQMVAAKRSPYSSSCMTMNILRGGWEKFFKKYKVEESELTKEFENVINGELDIGKSTIDEKRFSDPEFMQQLLREQDKLLEILSKNYRGNVLEWEEAHKMRETQTEQMAMGSCPMKRASGEVGSEKTKKESDDDAEVNEVADLFEQLEMANGEVAKEDAKDQKKIDLNLEELDVKRWTAGQKTSKNAIVRFFKKMIRDKKAKNLVEGFEWDLRKSERMTGMRAFREKYWPQNKWTAIPRLFLYYLNPNHCVGFGNLVNNFKYWFASKERKQKLRDQKEEQEYRRKGTILFNLFCHVHMLNCDGLDSVDVPKLLASANRKQQLDQILRSLHRFTLSTLLIPLKQYKFRNGQRVFQEGDDLLDDLANVRALLTQKQLLEELEEHSKQTHLEPAGTRRRRAVVEPASRCPK